MLTGETMAQEQLTEPPSEVEAFREVKLDLEAAEAIERIHNHLKGLSVSETTEGFKLRDSDGMVVATLAEYERRPGEIGVILCYRVGPSPSLRSVRRGRRVYEILEPHIW